MTTQALSQPPGLRLVNEQLQVRSIPILTLGQWQLSQAQLKDPPTNLTHKAKHICLTTNRVVVLWLLSSSTIIRRATWAQIEWCRIELWKTIATTSTLGRRTWSMKTNLIKVCHKTTLSNQWAALTLPSSSVRKSIKRYWTRSQSTKVAANILSKLEKAWRENCSAMPKVDHSESRET